MDISCSFPHIDGLYYTNPVTLARMMTMNPLTADPKDVAVFFDVPAGYGVMPDTAKFIVKGHKDADQPEEVHEFILVTAEHPMLLGFQLSPADQENLVALQAKLRGWKSDPSLDAGGSVSVFGLPCKQSEFTTLDGTFSIFVRLQEGQNPLPLVRNAPLRNEANDDDLAKLPLCQ